MSEIITITNQKGGVGKTTTAYNLASSLSRYNKRILLVDLDPQGNCSQAIGVDPTILKRTASDLFLSDCELRKIIKKTNINNIYLIPANLSLAMVESTLINRGEEADIKLLKKRLDEKEVQLYDFIIIDCPPSLGFLSLNALSAGNSLIVPVQCEYFALDALAQLLATISHVQRTSNPDLDIMGLLLTMFDSRTKLSTDIAQEVRTSFRDHVFTSVIPRNVSIPEAIAKGLPVNQYKPGSSGALAYMSLAREVMAYVENKAKK